MKHLLLAGNGFVGRVTAQLFRENGWKVTTLSRSGAGDEVADISSLESLRELSGRIDSPTHIVHCASASGGGEDAYRAVYLNGVQNLQQVFPSAKLLFTSSTSVYPQVDGSLVTEESPTELDRETGKILLAAEKLVLASGGYVARLAGVYGNGRSYLLRRFIAGEGTMEEDGSRLLNHTHNEDAASGILFLLENDSEAGIYNICDSTPRSQKETYELLSEKFNQAMPASVPRNLQSKRGWSHKAVSNAKIRSLGWQPKYPSLIHAAKIVVELLK